MFKSKILLKKKSSLTVLGILAFVLISFSFYKMSQNKIFEGDLLLNQGKYNQGVVKFEEAQKLWPFLTYNQSFQKKITQNKQLAEKRKLVTIILKNNTKEVDRETFTIELKKISGVKEVKYLSKEDALNEYKKQYKDQPDLIKIVSQTIDFPERIEVLLNDEASQDNVIQLAKAKTFVEEASKYSITSD